VGLFVFLLVAVIALRFLFNFWRSLEGNLAPRSRRRVELADDLLAPLSTPPPVPPATTVKILERPPEVRSAPNRSLPTPTPPGNRATQVAAKFDYPLAKTEESVLLRCLVQAMSIVGAIGVDISWGTHYSFSVILFGTSGAVWSWYRRHNFGHWLNSSVSLASVVIVMSGIVPNLVRQQQLNGGLLLVILALGLQMCLSFHLYNRQLLGYCLAASTLPMAVAASASQNIIFPIVLSGFVALAIPALMLDYRSRLALAPIGLDRLDTPKQLSYRQLPWPYLGRLAGLAIGLGLMFSLFVPNLRLPDLALPNRPPPPQQEITTNPPPAVPAAPPPPTPSANVREAATKLFSQPQNNNYPSAITGENLQLPIELATPLQQFVRQILATSPQPLDSDFERAVYLAEYLKQHHQEDASKLTATDAIETAIAKCKIAPQNCQFAADRRDLPVIYTSMLRSIGIPARLKIDDKPARFDPQTKMYLRPPTASASPTEVYFPNWGWFGMDAAPDRPLFTNDAQQLAQLQSQLQQVATSQPPPATSTSPPAPPNSPTPPSNLDRQSPTTPADRTPTNLSPPRSPDPAQYPDLAILRILFMLVAIGGGIAWWLWYRKQQQQQLAKLPPIEQIYRLMLSNLSKTERAKSPSQTQLEYARSIEHTEQPQINKLVLEISQLYTAWRYGKQKIDPQRLMKKLQHLQHLQQLAAQQHRQQLWARVRAGLTNPLRSKHKPPGRRI
jgi:uncharacterized protein YneF (UPF0154 family)